MKRYVIIVAGGAGVRFGTSVPKQFQELNKLPVIMHSINIFKNHVDNIILVLPELYLKSWDELCAKHKFTVKCKVTSGGVDRTESVKSGLKLVDDSNSIVAIHDAVRPLVSEALVSKLFEGALEFGSAIPVIKPKDSIRLIIDKDHSESVKRESYLLVQTPQVFKSSEIIEAYNSKGSDSYTDDASIYQNKFGALKLFNGESWNIKITEMNDLIIAESLIARTLKE